MFNINPDIKKSPTLPSEFYREEKYFEQSKEKIFSRTWQFIGDTDLVKVPGQVHPFTLLDGFMNEPLLLTRDYDDNINCMSNICTHRANIICEGSENVKSLRCRYHGRQFDLTGKFKFMPEFDQCENFPSERDNLPKVNFETFNNLIFASLNPVSPFAEFFKEVKERLQWFPFDKLVLDTKRSKDYLVKAHWALYCENYLEGFHIPYIHKSLNDALDYANYTQEIYKYTNLQVGRAKSGEVTFDNSPEKEIVAYYYWIFPNMMFNFYPWGLSINIVRPIEKNLTKVSFITYISDESKYNMGAGAGLDRVEREDEAIVENVQRGINSQLYKSGRFSPFRETGVHHFHSLIQDFMSK
jgi:choline monooxygenase